MFRKFIRFAFWSCVLGGFVGSIFIIGFLTWGYHKITRDLPKMSRIEDYRPAAVTKILDVNGILLGEFYEERRYPVKLQEVPEVVRQAFLAAEDATFYQHPGIDLLSIGRAAVKNLLAGSKKQGGSTITQQVVKRLLLSPEKDYRRKIKEAILAYRLEQRLSKDDILEIYLNEMFFGNTAYGIKAAAKLYFHKNLADVTIAEAALLAGLLKAPSKYSPVLSMARAKKRQLYVLGQMQRSGFITQEQRVAAEQEEVEVFRATNQKIYRAPFYVTEIRRYLIDYFGSESEVDEGGYEVHAAVDVVADEIADRALKRGLREVDKRRGWRGVKRHLDENQYEQFLKSSRESIGQALKKFQVYEALVVAKAASGNSVEVKFGGFTAPIDLKGAVWARKIRDAQDHVRWGQPEREVNVGDVIEIAIPDDANVEQPELIDASSPRSFFALDQTPDIEGAIVILDPHSGEVVAMRGGYDYDFQRSVLNRVTQSRRQPGSAFKPVVYLAAIDSFGYTPSTIVYDERRTFRIGDQVWTPGNFDSKFLGPITLRTALQRSRNLVSADIISRIGVDAAINYARKLGIESPLGRNLSLSLGSSEVTLLELARAYGVFAARGVLFQSVFASKIVDRDGITTYDYNDHIFEAGKQAINANSAFIMAYMMKGVVEHGTGYRVRPLGRPTAGKTGTSNDQMDAWFIGYTPEWVCGVWTGFDLKKKIGEKETGGAVSAPTWLYAMQEFYEYEDKIKVERLAAESALEAQRLGIESEPVKLEPLDFTVPEGVDPFWVDKDSGAPAEAGSPNAIYEYFIRGTEPKRGVVENRVTEDYLGAGDL